MTSALFAGVVAGLLAALLHFALVQDLILQAETYESGDVTHYAGVTAAAGAEGDHTHAEGTAPHAHPVAATGDVATTAATHDGHDYGAGDIAGFFSRDVLTVMFTALIYVGYALLLVAGFGVASSFGIRIGLREGLLWGVAGFAAFQLAPAAGLAPELPGSAAADLTDRQMWWYGTVLATSGALALIGYGRRPLVVLAGIALLALPHVIGAPHAEGYAGVAPPELAATFAARVLAVGLVAWACLGAVAGWFWNRAAT